ncbi:hypothetical protein KIPB_006928 [Kipferlia bialata]|uniref:Uncharacterized protein n=1 Tax=Kipferlia bialata TaxID=797122 RepID=A0A391NM36_9EUKA|nr:hypothetical protein KIPB_006928 [Kipferlia bialata]|eukprot:g6928.t1
MPDWFVSPQLRLGCLAMTSGDAAHLARCLEGVPRLEVLDISSNYIGPEGALSLAGALSHVPLLTELTLCVNTISDDGTLAIASDLLHVPRLKSLNLGSNDISDVGLTGLADALGHVPRLTRIWLHDNDITAVGVGHLVDRLPAELSLLVLSGNPIGRRGGAFLGNAIPQLPMLDVLSLDDCGMGRSLCKAMETVMGASSEERGQMVAELLTLIQDEGLDA